MTGTVETGLLSRAPEVLLGWAARGLWLLVATRALWAAALAVLDRGDEAIVVAALTPVYALIAWQLPRLRSRSVALLLLWFGVFAVRSVWNDGALGGVGLTPSGRGLALIVEGAGLAVGALAYFAAHRWRVERGLPLDWGDVARALLMLLGLAAVATIVVASRDAPYLDRLVHSAIAQAVALGVFVVWVLPRMFPPIERELEQVFDAPSAPRVVSDDPFRELSLPEVDDDALAGGEAEGRAEPPRTPPSRATAGATPTAAASAPTRVAEGAPTGPSAAADIAGAGTSGAVDTQPASPRAGADVAGAAAPSSPTRRYAPTGARAARPARIPSTVVAAASVAAVAVAVVLETSRAASPPPPPPPAPSRESSPAAGASSQTPSPRPVRPPPVLDEGEPFGGQALAWWSDALATASAGSSSSARARAALLRERLERAGLVLGPELDEVRVPPALAERRERMGLDEPPSVGRISVARGTLATLASAVREQCGGDRALAVPGGVRATLSPRPGPRAAMRVEFAIDPSHEGEEAALDRLALHALLFASAHEVESWHHELERVGAAMSIEYTSTSVALSLSAPAAEFTGLARRWLRVVLTPRLDERRLPIARRRALADHVDADADAEPAKRVAALVLDRYGFAAKGEAAAEIYGHLSAAEVRQRLAVFAPANARVMVAGAFDVDALGDALASYRGGVARPPAKLGRALAGKYRAHGLRPLHLVAYPLTLATPAEVAEAVVFAALLEERLFHQLRDEGQAYVVQVEAVRDGWQDLLVVQVPLGPEASASLAGALTVALGRVARLPVEASELERSQRFVLEALRAADTDPERRVRSALLGGPPAFVAELTDAVLRVEAAALPERVGTWIEPSRAIHVELDPWHGVRRAPERSR